MLATPQQEVTDNIGEAYPVKITKIKPNPKQPRKYFSMNKLMALANSLEEGQETPISLKKDPREKGTFIILDGERRWRAMGILHDRTGVEPTIKAFITVVKDDAEFYRRSVVANLHREDLSDLDEAAALANLSKDGMTVSRLASMIDKSTSYVNNRIKLDSLSEKVKELMSLDLPKEERLSTTSATDIVLSTKNHDLQLELAKEAIERNLGVESVRDLISVRIPQVGFATSLSQRSASRGHADTVETKNVYKGMSTFLGATKNRLARLIDQDLEAVFFDRDDEKRDREFIDSKIHNIIIDLKRLQAKVRSQP